MFFHFLNPKLPWRKTKYQVLHIPPKSLSNSPIVSEICTTEQGNQNQFCYADFCTETKTVNLLVAPEFLPKMREAKCFIVQQNPNLVASDSYRKLRSISFHLFLFFFFFLILIFVLPFCFSCRDIMNQKQTLLIFNLIMLIIIIDHQNLIVSWKWYVIIKIWKWYVISRIGVGMLVHIELDGSWGLILD